jgi:hypothetical protein
MVGTWNIPPFTFAFNFAATIFFVAYVCRQPLEFSRAIRTR